MGGNFPARGAVYWAERPDNGPLRKDLNTMKRKVIALILCLISVLALAACGSSAAQEDKEELVGADPSTWGPEEHTALADAEAAAGIEMGIPDAIGEYSPTAFLTWYERAYIDAVYTDGDGNIAAHVRKAAGDEDISGDYNDYSETSAQEIGGHSVTVKGEGGKIMTAVWADGGYSFSVSVDSGLTADELAALIAEVK